MADEETARLTAALVALEREHHALKVRYRRLAEDCEHAEESARVWRRVAYRLMKDNPAPECD